MHPSILLRTILSLLALVASSVIAFYCLSHGYYLSSVFMLAVCVAIMVQVCVWQQRSTHMFIRMLTDLRSHDFSLHYAPKGKTSLEHRLAELINSTVERLKERDFQQVERMDYYETLLNTIDSCLLVTDSSGKIHWMNRSAEQRLCGHPFHALADLRAVHADLPRLVEEIQPGEIKTIRVYQSDTAVDWAVTTTVYLRKQHTYKLVHLRDLRSLLEENEMEAWQKLIRVLTHEIMNSIAPIISLSDTLADYTQQSHWNEQKNAMVQQGLETIHRRSKGLLAFVENYRKLTRISSPMLAPVKVNDLFLDMHKLFVDTSITYDLHDAEELLMIDRSQVEQVLINLIKNAKEACSDREKPEIRISSSLQSEHHLYIITVSDNGRGIMPEVMDKIFVPFFTTKPSGSGIGLSLCKQIMTLHNGSISVSSDLEKGSCFTLKFVIR